jgi:hypothetical protein
VRCAGNRPHGIGTRALLVLLWRAGLRSARRSNSRRAILTGRAAQSSSARSRAASDQEAGVDPWGWDQLAPRLQRRVESPVGALLCIITGATCGGSWSAAAARTALRQLSVEAGVRCRFAPHQRRHAHAVEMAREGVSLNVIQRQLGHANLGITSIYLEGIDNAEIIETVHTRQCRCYRPAPGSPDARPARNTPVARATASLPVPGGSESGAETRGRSHLVPSGRLRRPG